MRETGNMTHLTKGDVKCIKISVGIPLMKRGLGRPGYRPENNIKVNFGEMRCKDMDRIQVAPYEV
jgi:hypothetical protein